MNANVGWLCRLQCERRGNGFENVFDPIRQVGPREQAGRGRLELMERRWPILVIGSSLLALLNSVINRPGASPQLDAVAC
jgi:hypothetical protein